jgi:hypothetical protein
MAQDQNEVTQHSVNTRSNGPASGVPRGRRAIATPGTSGQVGTPAPSGFVGIERASQFLGRTKNAIYTMVERRQIPYYKLHGRLLFDLTELDHEVRGFREEVLEHA